MQALRRRGALARPLLFPFCTASALLAGCASPGPPRPPSLQLPGFVSDLSATRSGDQVALRFTVPVHTTDGQLLRTDTVSGSLCRQIGTGSPCTPVDIAETRTPLAVPKPDGSGHTEPVQIQWTDNLPPALHSGAPRVIAYRVELRNAAGRSAGYSESAYTAAGAAPPAITALTAHGVRPGIELQWAPIPGAGEVLLRRTEPTSQPEKEALARRESRPAVSATRPKAGKLQHVPAGPSRKPSAEPGVLWLQANPGDRAAAATLDTRVTPGVPYTYSAVRREVIQIGGRTLELRSAPSPPAAFTWRDIYPPAAPTGLTALGYAVPAGAGIPAAASAPPGTFAVDLIWQPVEDARLAGYLVYRQELNAAGDPIGQRTRLTSQPVPSPSFHDAAARADQPYRYSVTAIDPSGNESQPVTTVVNGSTS